MKTYIFLPPVKKPTGGVAVLRQVADILHQEGHDAFLVARDQTGWTPPQAEDAAPVLEWTEMHLNREDVWMVPEGWVNALTPGFEARATCLAYVQNWAYLFSSLPEGVDWHNLPVEFLAVSEPVSYFIKKTICKDAPVLRPGIDRSIFYPPTEKRQGPITIAYMPRKNKALVGQIKSIFEHQCGGQNMSDVRWLSIEGMDANGVAEALRSSHIFLVTGFPEGCPLPPLEAMACGCLPIGFTGFGGWDYMRQIQMDARFSPWWPVHEVNWQGNGMWCADGDVLDAALSLTEAVSMIREGSLYLDVVLEAGQETANAYATEVQRRSVLSLWKAL